MEKIAIPQALSRIFLLNPLMGGKLDTQELEIRRDPLTGRQSVFNPSLEDKAAFSMALRTAFSWNDLPARANRHAFFARIDGNG